MTDANDWRAWKKTCAIDLCLPEVAASLRRFGAMRFAGYVKRAGFSAVDAGNSWHLLETSCQVNRTRAGKRYKDWLFARADVSGGDWVSAVESGASLLMRSAAREFLRREQSPRFMTSLEQPIAHGACCLADLLPDSIVGRSDVEEAELDSLAGCFAAEYSVSLKRGELALLWARTHGISFADPQVGKLTRHGKSVLYEQFKHVLESLSRRIEAKLPGEDAGVQRDVMLRTVEKLGNLAREKLFPGKRALSIL